MLEEIALPAGLALDAISSVVSQGHPNAERGHQIQWCLRLSPDQPLAFSQLLDNSASSVTGRGTKRDTACSRWVPGPQSWIVQWVAPEVWSYPTAAPVRLARSPPPAVRSGSRWFRRSYWAMCGSRLPVVHHRVPFCVVSFVTMKLGAVGRLAHPKLPIDRAMSFLDRAQSNSLAT
jgi:hypothetical protein